MERSLLKNSRRHDLLCLLLLAMAVVLLYGHTLHAPWYLDDHGAILENATVRDVKGAAANILIPRGVAFFTFALNYRLGGINPFGFHLVNLILHLGNGVLVFFLLKRLVRSSPLWPFFGALLFLCHPLQTQAITYIVQRMTSLSAFFFFAALYAFLCARSVLTAANARISAKCLGLYLSALLFGALAVFTKENAALLPLVLLLWLRLFPEAGDRRRILSLSLLPFCIAPLLLAGLKLAPAVSTSVSLVTITGVRGMEGAAIHPSLSYLFTEFSVLWIYIRLLFLPYGQAFDHAYPLVTQLLTVQNLIALTGLAGLLALAVKLKRRQPLIALGIAWFFVTLAIESTVIPLDPLYEHRLYLPLFGFVLVLIGGAKLLPANRGLLVLGVGVLACFPLTWTRNQLWNDPLALYTDNLRQTPDNVPVLTELGRRYREKRDYAKAETLLRKALQIEPNFSSATINLAELLLAQKRYSESLELLLPELSFLPVSKYLLYNLSANYFNLGDRQKAATYLEQALAIDPDFADANALLARIMISQGHWPQAERLLAKALLMNDDQALLHFEHAVALHGEGRFDECRAELERSLQLDPKYSDALLHLGLLALETGSRQKAEEYLERLRRMNTQAAAELQAELEKTSGRP